MKTTTSKTTLGLLKEAHNSGVIEGKEMIEKDITSWSITDFKQFREMCCDKFDIPKYNRK